MADPKAPLDPTGIRTVSVLDRASKVNEAEFAGGIEAGMSFSGWLDALPDILAAKDIKEIAGAIVKARADNKPVVLGMGAHVIKVGLSPLIISLMEEGVITGIGMNGSCVVHDFEVALMGRTSEDVAESLDDGSFGMGAETAQGLNKASAVCANEEIGLGRALGEAVSGGEFEHQDKSILAAAVRLDVPATVHVAIGTDIIHMHPSADGAAIGSGSLRDFLIFSAMVAELSGGVYINLGSAVIMPEVFLKALSLARNQGHEARPLTTVNMDFIQHYRPGVNVVERPTRTGGKGYRLTGHHEIMFPLLAAVIFEERARVGQ